MDVVERDYAIGHVLAALYARGGLAEALVFKGGTALKKAYFGDYRFSVDLDFTSIDGPRGAALMTDMAAVAEDAQGRLYEHGAFSVAASRRPGQGPHPTGQEAFKMLVGFPWHGQPLCSIKLEVTVDEPLLLPAADRPLLHGYQEPLEAHLRCYALEEIAAEKLRTILQAQKRAGEHRWLRNCARDYYDLWRLCVGSAPVPLDFATVRRILPDKCAVREVGFTSVDDFFPSLVVEDAARRWDSSLANLVRPLPDFATALEELRASLSEQL